jgi:hypothetical protein
MESTQKKPENEASQEDIKQ